jgi:hypothetical protein
MIALALILLPLVGYGITLLVGMFVGLLIGAYKARDDLRAAEAALVEYRTKFSASAGHEAPEPPSPRAEPSEHREEVTR